MALADIHIHLLFGVDDGAKDEDEMHAILDIKTPRLIQFNYFSADFAA